MTGDGSGRRRSCDRRATCRCVEVQRERHRALVPAVTVAAGAEDRHAGILGHGAGPGTRAAWSSRSRRRVSRCRCWSRHARSLSSPRHGSKKRGTSWSFDPLPAVRPRSRWAHRSPGRLRRWRGRVLDRGRTCAGGRCRHDLIEVRGPVGDRDVVVNMVDPDTLVRVVSAPLVVERL